MNIKSNKKNSTVGLVHHSHKPIDRGPINYYNWCRLFDE